MDNYTRVVDAGGETSPSTSAGEEDLSSVPTPTHRLVIVLEGDLCAGGCGAGRGEG